MRISMTVVALAAAFSLAGCSRTARTARAARRRRTARTARRQRRDRADRSARPARRPWLERPARAAPGRLRPERQLRSHLQPGRETDLGDLPRRYHRHLQERRHRGRHLLERDRTGLGAVHEAVNDFAPCRGESMMHDILIRGGILFDGTGNPGVAGDLAIADGRIAAIGRHLRLGARKIIDAEGLAVAPGFIDIKTHSDFTLPINPKAESKVRQGVTTEIIGHCGFSVAPALPGKVELLKDYLSPSAPWLPFRETSFPGLSANVSADRGECRHAGRPQHAAPDGDGHGGARAERGRACADDRAPRRRARCRRARHVVGPVHAARLLRGAGRNDRARPCAQAAQCRLFHPLTRRVEQSDRGGRGGDRGRRAMRRACRDRALQMLRHGQLGQGRPRRWP